MKVKARFCWEHQTDNRPWEECYVPCPDDCVLSEWGQWSQCPDPCQPKQPGPAIRVRTRRILAHSGRGKWTLMTMMMMIIMLMLVVVVAVVMAVVLVVVELKRR